MYEELIGLLRDYGRDCTGNDMCENCSIQHFCENGWTPSEIADAIEELSKYADAIRKLKCEGWYLQQTKYQDGYQAVAIMPLPEPLKEET